MTSPGENLSDPQYGVGLRRFLFDQNIESTRDSIASAVSRQISRYLPYLNLENVEVGATSADIDMNSMSLRVIYNIPDDATQQIFELNLNSETTIGFY